MEISGSGKSANSSLSFRYNANNEELEELYHVCEDDPPTPRCEISQSNAPSENASPKKLDKTSSLIDKYFKSMRTEKNMEKPDESKTMEETKSAPPKDVSSSPMKEYLNRLGKKNVLESSNESKEGPTETWKIFHDFKFKIAQAVEDIKTRSVDDTKEKSVVRDNSISDSEESSAIKDCDQQSVGDTDNQVSSLDSSIQNLSDLTQPLTAKATELESSLPLDNTKNNSESSDDTHKNLVRSDSADGTKDLSDDNNIAEVESGVEAFEDSNLDCYGFIPNMDTVDQTKPNEVNTDEIPSTPANFGFPSSNGPQEEKLVQEPKRFCIFFTLPMYILTFLLVMNYFLYPNSSIFNGFLLGMWCFCLISNLKQWLLERFFTETDSDRRSYFQLKRTSALPPIYTIPSIKEHTPLKKYEGWLNHYRYTDYDPYSYHINKTTTAFIKLEGCNLRISYTGTKIAKRALWDEKLENVTFYQHRLYNLTGARVILLPKGLVRKRQWSKKYPICIILNEKEKIQVLEKESVPIEKKGVEDKKNKEPQTQHEETETNVSPEKKKKFIWRRREKSISHNDAEPGKEGLRHRFVRKMHREKKTDSVPTFTEPTESAVDKNFQLEDTSFQDSDLTNHSATSTAEIEEDLDDTDLSKIKEFLEEAEMDSGADGGAEGEWSVHIRHSGENHSHLYLFARTGRDKHEWYRRFHESITEAQAAMTETTAAEDKSTSDSSPDNKENVEMAVYKVSEKETVAFGKTNNKSEAVTEGTKENLTSSPSMPPNFDEKTFWPYLYKIIQMKSSPSECDCRMLPAEVTWLNTVVARIIYDVMRDPVMITRLQARIQRKLHTLKLPSFMSPLLVTELSLAGACPLVQRVLPPACDERGVWLDADLRYDGGAYIAILTQINLMKLKEKNIALEDQILATNENIVEPECTASFNSEVRLRKRKPAIFDSEVEDSAESSSDDESPSVQPVDSGEKLPRQDTQSQSNPTEGGSSKKKFLRMVDKIAMNKYFQQVTDYKYIKRAMEGLSNTDIKLQLEVNGLEGRLVLNLPTPPHDRIWIGFRTNPQLVLKARPAVGARTLHFKHISNWIEQKLSKEFEKVLVLPNMEDFTVDLMTPTPVQFE